MKFAVGLVGPCCCCYWIVLLLSLSLSLLYLLHLSSLLLVLRI